MCISHILAIYEKLFADEQEYVVISNTFTYEDGILTGWYFEGVDANGLPMWSTTHAQSFTYKNAQRVAENYGGTIICEDEQDEGE